MHRQGLLRLLVAASSATFMTCDAHANQPDIAPPPPATPPPAAPPDHFDPDVVRVDPGSALARARRADPTEARSIATEALPGASAEEALRLRWVAAAAARRLEDRAGALELLEPVASSEHPLARWATLLRAELLEQEDPAAAARIASPLTPGWAGARRARMVEARALARAGDPDAAIPLLRRLVEETDDRVGAASVAIPLARLLAARDDVAAREEALALYRRVATRAPLSDIGEEADRLAAEVLATLPPRRRRDLEAVPIDDAFRRAEALFDANRHAEAEAAYAELASRLRRDRERRCRARLYQGKAMLRRRAREEGARHLIDVAGDCASVDIKADARYNAGRALAQLERLAESIAQYEALEREAPASNLADDALYRAAIAARDSGDADGMIERLTVLPARYPEGDMRGESRFALGFHFYRAGQHDRAFEVLDASHRDGAQETAEDIHGRTAYWRARVLAALARRDDAMAAYEELARARPLSYYAQQSLARLGELDATRAAALLESMRAGDAEEPLVFPLRAELDQPAFLRALELLRVGETDLAGEELAALGATGEGADPDMLWLTAALYHRAGALPEASLLVRRRLRSVLATVPTGRARQLWRLGYPQAFAPLIEEAAAAESIPPSFVRAVAREESAFDPEAVSVANAIGLIQLIRPTARRFARPLGLPHDARALKKPEINLRIGSRYISFLWQRYPENPAVVPSAYNAGHGAVDRWLRERPGRALDEWIEEIPYDETRRYTRRVLQTYGIYAWLDRGELPPLPATIPPR